MEEAQHPDEESPRKGRSNAIATYELLAGFDRKLTTIGTRLDGLVEAQEGRDDTTKDHEARLRTLEATVTAYIAGATQGKTDRTALWASVATIAALALQTVALIVAITIRLHP